MREPGRHELRPHPRRHAVVGAEHADAALIPDTRQDLSAAHDPAAREIFRTPPSPFVRLLKPAEVAEELGVSRSWVYAAAEDGRLPSVRLGGPDGPLRFVPEDLHRWLQDARANWRPGRRRATSR
jgi:excisionase family DNA binding protein